MIRPHRNQVADRVAHLVITPLGPTLVVISSWSYFYDHRSVGMLFLALFCAVGYGMWWAAELDSRKGTQP